MVFVTTTQLCHCMEKAARGNPKMKGYSNKTLFIGRGSSWPLGQFTDPCNQRWKKAKRSEPSTSKLLSFEKATEISETYPETSKTNF